MNITIIGSGNMGGAIASALSERKEYSISIYDSCIENAQRTAKGKAIEVLSSLDVLTSPDKARNIDVLLIALKPQVLPSVYNDLRKLNPKMIISIAAGVSLSTLQKELGTNATGANNTGTNTSIVRFMPNIAARTRRSVTAVAFQANTSDEDKKIAMDIATSFGSAFELNEGVFPAFTGISSSAIAYVFEFMHQLAMGGVREGIPYNDSLSIVRDTLESAISLQKEGNKGAIELETMVCSAAGTTIEGIKALADGAFGKAVIDAVSAAANKSRELEKKS